MKAILITILVVIVLIFGINKLLDQQRFTLENYQYQSIDEASIAVKDPLLKMRYYQKVAQLDGHVITQWSTEKIDVRHPENDDQTTLAARARYDELLGEVTYLEKQLQRPEKTISVDTLEMISRR